MVLDHLVVTKEEIDFLREVILTEFRLSIDGVAKPLMERRNLSTRLIHDFRSVIGAIGW